LLEEAEKLKGIDPKPDIRVGLLKFKVDVLRGVEAT